MNKSIFVLSMLTVLISFSCIAETNNNDKRPMLWDFGAKKCMPCIKMVPILDQLSVEYKDYFTVKFTDVWISKNIREAKNFGIESIPTQIFFDKNSKELWRHTGYISKKDILSKWKSLGYDFNKSHVKVNIHKEK
jgi:thioredoxin 1